MKEMLLQLARQVETLQASNEELQHKLDKSAPKSEWGDWWRRNSKLTTSGLDDALSAFDGSSLLYVFNMLHQQADQGFPGLQGVSKQLEQFYQKNVPKELPKNMAPIIPAMPDLRTLRQDFSNMRRGMSAEMERQMSLHAHFGAQFDLTKALENPLKDPKKRQYLAVVAIFSVLPLSVVAMLVLAVYCLFYDSSRVVSTCAALYLAFIWTDRAPWRSARPVKLFQKGWVWGYFRDYFPIELRKANPATEFSPDKSYIFGYHPHGVISVGCWGNFCTELSNASKLFPGLTVHPATLNMNFQVPFFRDFLLFHGVISVSRSSIQQCLRTPGHAPLVVVGGAAEALDAAPGKHELTLRRRNGFFRLALQNGSHLVPVYSFGENDIFLAPYSDSTTWLRRLQTRLLKLIGVSFPLYSGAGYLCLPAVPLSPIPRRKPIITVVGDPIPCPRIEQPTQADIDVVKEKYVAKLREIFERFADKYAPDRKGGLTIVA